MMFAFVRLIAKTIYRIASVLATKQPAASVAPQVIVAALEFMPAGEAQLPGIPPRYFFAARLLSVAQTNSRKGSKKQHRAASATPRPVVVRTPGAKKKCEAIAVRKAAAKPMIAANRVLPAMPRERTRAGGSVVSFPGLKRAA